MKLNELNVGDKAVIEDIQARRQLKHRMKSFGIYPGAEIEIKRFSIGKSNVELLVGNSLIAIRRGEMEKITVNKHL